MFQGTRSVEDHDNKTVYKTKPRYGRFFVKILRVFWAVIRKIVANVMTGVHIFVGAAGQLGPSHNEYW